MRRGEAGGWGEARWVTRQDIHGVRTPTTVTVYIEVHYTTVLKSSIIKGVRKADFINPAEEFDLGPLPICFSVQYKEGSFGESA